MALRLSLLSSCMYRPVPMLGMRLYSSPTPSAAPEPNISPVSPSTLDAGYLNMTSKNRPLSPHLTIYEPQLTTCMSIFHRFTGTGLGTVVYGLGIYAALKGGHFDLTYLSTWLSHHPMVHLASKAFLALPFTYHLWNGIRHLIWDTGSWLSIDKVYIGGYIALVLTLVSTVYLIK